MPAKPTRQPKPAARKPNRAKTERTGSSAAIGIVAAAAAIAGGLVAAFRFGVFNRAIAGGSKTSAEHAAPELAADRPHPGPEDRASPAFRPDPTAPVTAAEREALRPATMPISGIPDTRSETVN